MSGVNKVILIGNLGREPDTKHTQNGTTVCNFSIATSETYTDKSGERQTKTEWHRICAFGKLADICGQYLHKGKQVYIEGSLQTRKWEKDGQVRSSTEIVARDMTMLGFRGDGDSQNSRKEPQQDNEPGPNDGDIPF